MSLNFTYGIIFSHIYALGRLYVGAAHSMGGLVGLSTSYLSSIKDSYSNNEIQYKTAEFVGSFVGKNAKNGKIESVLGFGTINGQEGQQIGNYHVLISNDLC